MYGPIEALYLQPADVPAEGSTDSSKEAWERVTHVKVSTLVLPSFNENYIRHLILLLIYLGGHVFGYIDCSRAHSDLPVVELRFV